MTDGDWLEANMEPCLAANEKKGVVGKISDTFIILNVCILDWLLLKKNALNV